MNLYQKFVMQPPAKAALATRLMGARGATTGVAVPVPVSQARSKFFLRANDVPSSRPGVAVPYGLGAQGGLAGLSAFAGTDLVAGVTFENADAYKDFTGGLAAQHWRDGGGAWDPVPGAALSTLSKALQNAEKSGAFDAVMAAKDELSGLVREVSRLQQFDLGIGGRSPSRDQQYRLAMTQLKQLIYNLPARLNTAAAATAAQNTTAGGGSGGALPIGGGGYQRPGSAGGSASSAMTAGGSGSSSLLLIGGAVVAGIAGIFLIKKLRG